MIYKRGALFLALFLLIVSFASASHTASVSTGYVPIYETTSANVSVTVSNSLFSTNSINNVTILANGFNITGTFGLTGWNPNLLGNLINYYTTDHKISNWGSQTFGIELKADNVDQNTTAQWTVTTADTNNELQQNPLSILILNDDSPPQISNAIPQNNSFIRQGTNNQLFSMDATDPETGVQGISAAYGFCGNLSNNVQLTKANDTYSSLIDLSSYADSTVLCYLFTATNNGGSQATSEGIMTIDGVAPSVTLIAPNADAMMNNNSEFRYVGSDNLAPTLACALYVDSSEINSTVANNGEEVLVSVSDSPEGNHKWNVTCTDLVGLSNSSETRSFTLDKTPPLINVTSPASNSVNKAGIPVTVEVTDNYGIQNIWYEYQDTRYDNISSSFSVDTSNGTDGVNVITIHASDLAGNEAVLDYMFTIDRAPPQMDFISPAENTTVDLHVPYIFTATDNYDPLLDCEVYADNVLVANTTAQSGNQTLVIGITEPGSRTVFIRCVDDAENSADSSGRIIDVQDLSGPDITFQTIGAVARGNAVHIEAEITDYSGVENVSAILTDSEGTAQDISLSKNGDVYTADYPTTMSSPLGAYAVEITAADAIGNSNSQQEQFQVVYSYVLTMDVTSQMYPEEPVSITGNLKLDNGTPTAKTEINLVLPSGNATASIDPATGDFSYSFGAPSEPQSYEVAAWAVSEFDVMYEVRKSFEVISLPSSEGHHGGGGGGGHSTVTMPDTPNAGILNNTNNNEEKPQQVIVEIPNENSKVAEQAVQNNAVAEETNNAGIGRATSFFSALGSINWSGLLWILLLVLVLALVIKMFGGKGSNKRFSSDMDDYIRKLRK